MFGLVELETIDKYATMYRLLHNIPQHNNY
jgi:hypothetical protein